MKTSTIPGPLLPSLFQQQFFLGWTLELLQARWQPRWFFSSATSVGVYDSKAVMHFQDVVLPGWGDSLHLFIKTTHQVSYKQLAGKNK